MSHRHARVHDRSVILQRAPLLSVWQSLAVRALAVLLLVGIALAGHWVDRAGLKDNVDGEISFIDVVYFTAITVTTVGYGDIVPVTPQSRMFDTFVVTPIRIFVWLIFLGTAYNFILRNSWDKIRTRMMRDKLTGHMILCGFGAGGEFAARELIRSGTAPDQIVVVDPQADRVDLALSLGLIAIQGDATSNQTLDAANIACASSVLVSTSRDDAAALVVLSARQLNPHVVISASVRAQENEDLIHQAGATFILNPVRLGGQMLARSATARQAVEYMADLASADGRVMMRERVATQAEIGMRLNALSTGLGTRIVRGGQSIGFWEGDKTIIQPGDVLVEIVAQT